MLLYHRIMGAVFSTIGVVAAIIGYAAIIGINGWALWKPPEKIKHYLWTNLAIATIMMLMLILVLVI